MHAWDSKAGLSLATVRWDCPLESPGWNSVSDLPAFEAIAKQSCGISRLKVLESVGKRWKVLESVGVKLDPKNRSNLCWVCASEIQLVRERQRTTRYRTVALVQIGETARCSFLHDNETVFVWVRLGEVAGVLFMGRKKWSRGIFSLEGIESVDHHFFVCCRAKIYHGAGPKPKQIHIPPA